jgi:FkbM family methyltransferase
MFLIKEYSYNSEDPVYVKIKTDENLMFIPEARVAKDYFNTGFYEKGYINWVIENYIKPDKNVIDIGAHIGWYTVNLAKKCNHIYSFECSPKSFNYLCGNIALNSLDYKVTKYNCALSNDEGTTKYYIRDSGDGGGNGISKFEYDNIHDTPSIDVPKKKLDSFGLTNINFIKIDVEGHEKEVLEGSVQTIINNNYPPILFESWDEHHEQNGYPALKLQKELFEFLSGLGYNIVKVGQDMYVAVK